MPTVDKILKMHLYEMIGYYHCALGLPGFTEAGEAKLQKDANYIFVAMDSFSTWNSFAYPLGVILNNQRPLLEDVKLLLQTYIEE